MLSLVNSSSTVWSSKTLFVVELSSKINDSNFLFFVHVELFYSLTTGKWLIDMTSDGILGDDLDA